MKSSGRVLIVGSSLAGTRAAEALRREGHDGPITIVGAEAHLPYDRPPLSKQVLAGSMAAEDTALRVDDGLGAEWRLSTLATGLDLERRVVTVTGVAGGVGEPARAPEELGFDGLVIATGAHPRMLPGLADLEGVHVLRTLDDCMALRAGMQGGPRVVVVGAGFIGSEVAATGHGLGLDVTVLEALPVPLVRAIGEELGRRCARLHRDHGVALHLGVGVAGLVGTSRVEGVRLENGTVIPADLVVVGVGVAPNTGWLAGSGLDLADGVECDRWCRVLSRGRPVPDVVAAGDVARWDHALFGETMRVEHWTNAVEQGHAAAVGLIRGGEAPPFAPVPYFWSDQYETKIQFVGRTGPQMRVVEGSVDDDRFVAAFGLDGRLVGALSFNRPPRIMAYRAMIAAGTEFPLRRRSGTGGMAGQAKGCQDDGMRLLLLAPPGAGKGTQAERLSKHYGIEHISTGELLRSEVATGTPLGESVKEYLARGDLVPDDVIIDLIRDRIVQSSQRGGYLLDGFPRNLRQAEQARQAALEQGVATQAAIYLDVSHDESIRRLLGRSGQEGRADDNEDTIRHRLEVFERETLPLLDFYDSLGLLMRIDGERPVDDVTADILERLASLLPR